MNVVGTYDSRLGLAWSRSETEVNQGDLRWWMAIEVTDLVVRNKQICNVIRRRRFYD